MVSWSAYLPIAVKLEVIWSPTKHIFASHFFCLDMLEVVAGPGKHIFVCHFLRHDLLEVVAGLSKHIFACHFLRPHPLEVVTRPGKHILVSLFAPGPARSGRGPRRTPFCEMGVLPQGSWSMSTW